VSCKDIAQKIDLNVLYSLAFIKVCIYSEFKTLQSLSNIGRCASTCKTLVMNRIKILNVDIDNLSIDELLGRLKKGVMVTPNVDDIMKHQKDNLFHNDASMAEFSVCDSKIVKLSAKFLGTPLKETIPGSSFFPKYCEFHKNDNIKIFLLGAKEGVGEIAKEKINKRIGREIIIDTYSPPFGFEKNQKELDKIIELLKKTKAKVVLVGLGNPKQTKLIYKIKDRLQNIDLWLALGATIDFEAGNIKRAPGIFQKLALEWLYRLLKEPKRMYRRYLIEDMPFFWLLLKQKIGKYKDPFG